MIAGYTAPETDSGLTEDQAGAEILKLAQSFRTSQGQPEDGEPTETPDASVEAVEPESQETDGVRPDELTGPEGSDEDETSEDETDVEPEPSPRKRGRTLKVGGTEQFVDEDEAYNGYLRQADYTRKTQAASETAKQAEKERAAASATREKYDAGLKQIEDALTVMMPQEPDWDRVRAERPNEYGALYTDWRRFNDRLSLVKAERDRVEQERKAEQDNLTLARRKDAAERLYVAIPEWRDPVKRDADRSKLTSLAREYGYDEDEIAGIEDPRQVLILRDAMLYRELREKQAKAKASIGKAPTGNAKTARPGVPGTVSRPSTKVQAARGRLAKSGHVDDAAEAIFHMLRAPKRK